MEFQIDIDDHDKTCGVAGWLQCILVTMCMDRPDLTDARIIIKRQNLGWYVELIAYGTESAMATDAGGPTLESAADRAVHKFNRLRCNCFDGGMEVLGSCSRSKIRRHRPDSLPVE